MAKYLDKTLSEWEDLTERWHTDTTIKCTLQEYLELDDIEYLNIPNGDIIFPTGWDTEEKIERAILKSIKFIQGDPLEIKEPQPKQLSIFDFISR